MKLNRLALLPMLVAVHGKEAQHAMTPFGKQMENIPHFLRGLQPEPPDFPDPPEDNGEPASYCDFLFIFLDAQANAQGYDCECVEEEDKDTVTCNARNLKCDAYEVGDAEVICHMDHFNSSTTRGYVDVEGYKIFTFNACAEYSDAQFAPAPLVGSEFCFVYQLSVVWGQGYNLDECKMTYADAGGEPKDVCTCTACPYSTVGVFTYWGLGLDCDQSLIPGITLAECQPLTDTNPAVIPIIEKYEDRQDTDPTDTPPTDPSTTVAATETKTTVVASTEPATTVASTVTTVSPTVPSTTVSPATTTTTVPLTTTTTTSAAPIETTTGPPRTDPSTGPPLTDLTSAAGLMELKVAAAIALVMELVV